jgi:hypothetical protein
MKVWKSELVKQLKGEETVNPVYKHKEIGWLQMNIAHITRQIWVFKTVNW